MSYVRIWVHLVFSTKDRIPFLSKEIRPIIQSHIIDNCKEKGIYLTNINGYYEHIHCLISLDKNQTTAEIAKLIKGESSFWINREKLTLSKFSWQDDYFAVSIGESQVDRIQKYINTQEIHHTTRSFSDEYEELLLKYGWK